MIERILKYDESHKEIDGQLYKLCKICEEWFPCTEEYFYKKKSSKKDGVSSYCRKCEIQKTMKWGQANRDKMRGYYRKNNQTEVTKQRKYLFVKYQRESGYRKEWELNNKDKLKEYREFRESHKTHTILTKEWISCKEYFNNTCAYCGLPLDKHYNKVSGEIKLTDFHKEHVNHEGENDLSNCVPSCKLCNSSKHNNTLEDWYPKQEFFNEHRLNKIHKWLKEDYKLYYIEPKPKRVYNKKDSLHKEEDK